MIDLNCDPLTYAGPVDSRVVEYLSKRFPIDQDFLACTMKCHGCEPIGKSVSLDSGKYNVERLLTLYDFDSELQGPFRPHFENAGSDERTIDSIAYLVDVEHNTSNSLFSAIVPFAATQKGMCLDRGYVDLFCFDYRDTAIVPPVVIWKANNAMDAYFDWENMPMEEQFDDDENYINVNWDSFLLPVASSFSEFYKLLHANQ